MNKQELKEFINSDLYRLEGKYDIKSKINKTAMKTFLSFLQLKLNNLIYLSLKYIIKL